MASKKPDQLEQYQHRYGLALEEIKVQRSISMIVNLIGGTKPGTKHKFLESQLASQQKQLESLQVERNQASEDIKITLHWI